MFINTDRLSVTAVCMLQGKHKLWALTQPRPRPRPRPRRNSDVTTWIWMWSFSTSLFYMNPDSADGAELTSPDSWANMDLKESSMSLSETSSCREEQEAPVVKGHLNTKSGNNTFRLEPAHSLPFPNKHIQSVLCCKPNIGCFIRSDINS